MNTPPVTGGTVLEEQNNEENEEEQRPSFHNYLLKLNKMQQIRKVRMKYIREKREEGQQWK